MAKPDIQSKLVQFTYDESHKSNIADVLSSIVEFGSIAFILDYDGTWDESQDTTYKPSPDILPGNVIFANGHWYGTTKTSFEAALDELLDTLEIGHKGSYTIGEAQVLTEDLALQEGMKYSLDGTKIETVQNGGIILPAGTTYYPVTIDEDATGLFKQVEGLTHDINHMNYFNEVAVISGDRAVITGAVKPGATLTFKGEGATKLSTDVNDGIITISSTGGEVADDSQQFTIGTDTFALKINSDGKLYIAKTSYKEPTLGLSLSKTSLEYESGEQTLKIAVTRTKGQGYGEIPNPDSANPDSVTIDNNVGRLEFNSSVNPSSVSKDVTVSGNTTFKMTYTYYDKDKNIKSSTKTTTVSYNQYRWYVLSVEPSQVSDIKSVNAFATQLQQVTSLATGYTYVAIPSIWTGDESKTVQGATPNGIEFENAKTAMKGGWVYWSTIENVYTNVNYHVYRTTQDSMVNVYKISKLS